MVSVAEDKAYTKINIINLDNSGTMEQWNNGIKAKLVIHFGYLLDCCNFQSNILFRFRRNLKEMNLSIYLLFSAVRTLNGPRYPQGFLGSWLGRLGRSPCVSQAPPRRDISDRS